MPQDGAAAAAAVAAAAAAAAAAAVASASERLAALLPSGDALRIAALLLAFQLSLLLFGLLPASKLTAGLTPVLLLLPQAALQVAARASSSVTNSISNIGCGCPITAQMRPPSSKLSARCSSDCTTLAVKLWSTLRHQVLTSCKVMLLLASPAHRCNRRLSSALRMRDAALLMLSGRTAGLS
jgi:hypothetical protein